MRRKTGLPSPKKNHKPLLSTDRSGSFCGRRTIVRLAFVPPPGEKRRRRTFVRVPFPFPHFTVKRGPLCHRHAADAQLCAYLRPTGNRENRRIRTFVRIPCPYPLSTAMRGPLYPACGRRIIVRIPSSHRQQGKAAYTHICAYPFSLPTLHSHARAFMPQTCSSRTIVRLPSFRSQRKKAVNAHLCVCALKPLSLSKPFPLLHNCCKPTKPQRFFWRPAEIFTLTSTRIV